MKATREQQYKSEDRRIRFIAFTLILIVVGCVALAIYQGEPTVDKDKKINVWNE